MKLYSYFRSSAAYRVRIALNLKAIAYDAVAVHLSRNGGEQFGAAFDALNPQHLLPVLVDDGLVLNQSLAILEYLDETHPAVALLPPDAAGRARVRALARSADTGRFCHGDTPGMADCCLVPQVFNAQRFECDMAAYPTLMRIHDACMELDAFQAASPARQFDAA